MALAGGGPLGAMYEIGVLMALDESLEGLNLNDMDIYVGVSAGSFITAGLANQLTPTEIYRLFIDNDSRGTRKQGALKPELFLTPALREYGQRLKSLPGLAIKGLVRRVASPFRRTTMESFAPLTRAIPAGIFDNEGIARFLEKTFSQKGRTNDFRKLKRTLYSVAVDLDTGRAVTFGAQGQDHVPISKAVQASAALPGLFPPVEIDEHYYVDGALQKTLNASLALEDGAELVIGVNPLVPYDGDAANRRSKAEMDKLIEGGLPVVLSQTFRTLIHSRMHTGLEKYAAKYKNASIVLFEPGSDDPEMFFTNLFSYASRKRVCEHAYQRTRADLLKRRFELEPVFARFGIKLNIDALKDEKRTLDSRVFKQQQPTKDQRLHHAKLDLADAVNDLEQWVARARA
ncbi:MAG: patatin-like phospholipase family protein [Betaproteobacteria bacterium]|nr:patatin-like phospholipase family protein [Betaproteobacteria bacterium]